MGMAAILVMWPRCSEQSFIPHTHWGSIWILALIGPAVSEKKAFEVLMTDRPTIEPVSTSAQLKEN